MTDCQYYNSRKSDWGYTGGANATQWCSHPETNGLACDTDKCPQFEPVCNVCGTDEGEIKKMDDGSFACAYCEGCERPGRYGCGVCDGCQIYADMTFDLMREEGHETSRD